MPETRERSSQAESLSSVSVGVVARKQWFAVYTTSRHEKRVADHFDRRMIEHYLPLYHPQRHWKDGSKGTLSLPLFPGYVFVHVGIDERIPVLEVPGVLWMVGKSGSQPTPLPEFDIETLRVALDPMRVEPYPALAVGQRARLRRGALAGIEGIVVQRKNGLRVVITLELIMQSIAVEVNADDLEPIESIAGAFVADCVGSRGITVCNS
jgi:transcription antitermination factor NusG